MKQLTRHLLLATAMSGLAACAGLPERGLDQSGSLPSQDGAGNAGEQALGPYEKGKRALNQGDVGKAIEYFLVAHRREPESLEGINALAVSYDMLGRPDLADRYFAKALALAPRDPDILNNVGYAMLKRGDTERARKYLLEAKALSAENDVVLSNLAVLQAPSDIQEDAGQMAKASETFSADPGPTLAPVPVASVAEVPLSGSVSAPVPEQSPSDEPDQPETPIMAAAGPPSSQRKSASGYVEEPEFVSWDGPRVAPSSVQVAKTQMAAAPAIRLERRDSLTEVEPSADEAVQRPREADLIAALPAQGTPSGEAGVDGMPLSGSADEQYPVPARAGDIPCGNSLEGLEITLVNGNGREGMAARTRKQLALMGIEGKARLQNAKRYNHMESVITYSGDLACEAKALAELLEGKPVLQRDDSMTGDLSVLLGGDLLDFDARYVQNLK